ncbi:beta-eliminating lyase-related protein [Sphaerisporangium sp. TRM90804]|uniref:threonine aldolase family protein n=1 Tax=Sphaerisporangium sp. TRM90804 TaxID=3031113 RepID=UPI00244CAE4D|nr:beta-eliminating lyase-related protein [Sphaerisporangium sp. TRM90804]MDH2427669.1 beta-eliminating lyase-related protein [Sphaerisporangium sp. TRM90804]
MTPSNAGGGARITRSLFLHAPMRRMPEVVLRQMLERVEPGTPPDGPRGPVARLERRLAEMLGTQAALFFPTGTMAQQVALRVHAARRGREAFAAHPQTHLDVWERRGYAIVHGLRFHPAGDRHELMTAADLALIGEPLAAVVWELPQRDIGGLLPEWHDLVAQVAEVRAGGAAAHLDGARVFEAQAYYRRPLEEIAGLFDSVYVSLYKSLQGVRGAVLAGDVPMLREAATWRTRLGGNVHDAWPLALAALTGLDTLVPRMPEFRDHAVALAAAINADGAALAWPDPPQAPMFHVHLPAPRAAVERAGAAMIAEHGTQLFPRLRTSPDPTRCAFEVSVGENAMEFSPAEVVSLIRELLDRAAR